MGHFSDNDGNFELGVAPQGRMLEFRWALGSSIPGEAWDDLFLAGVSQGLWIHARSLC